MSRENNTMNTLTHFDPLGDAVLQEPADFYSALRSEAPLFQMPNGVYVISRFEDVQRATLDTDTFSSNLVAIIMSGSGRAEDSQLMEISVGEQQPTDVLAIADPPQHTRQQPPAAPRSRAAHLDFGHYRLFLCLAHSRAGLGHRRQSLAALG